MGWRHLALLFLALTSVEAVVQNTTRCFECTNVRDPADCTTVTECPEGQAAASQGRNKTQGLGEHRVTECPEGQQCMVEEFVTANGTVLYNSRCQSKQKCGLNRRMVKSDFMARRSASDILVCMYCCDGEFCNDNGCGSSALSTSTKGPTCFNCEEEGIPRHCSKVSRCDTGQVCMLTEFGQKQPDGSTFYRSDCVSPNVCQAYALVGKRKRNTYCHVCCYDNYCNDHCVEHVTPVPTTPTTLTTTTRTTTTISTTTTTNRPTTTNRDLHAILCRHHKDYHYDAHSHLCYKFHDYPQTWDLGNGICKLEGGTLAIIDTEAKWAFLRDKLRADPHYSYHHAAVYIGGRIHSHHGSLFYWPNGHHVTHAHWAPGQPTGRQDCVYLNGTDAFLWHDVPCSFHFPYVCTIQV